jgi:hypothetical protein
MISPNSSRVAVTVAYLLAFSTDSASASAFCRVSHKPPALALVEGHNAAAISVRGGGGGGVGVSVKSYLAGTAAASVVAGSIAGAIGIGVAFPLDTLKTKAQVMARERSIANAIASRDGAVSAQQVNMFQIIAMVWRQGGWQGFFGGVKGMMAGQALIKALAFTANASALVWLTETFTDVPNTFLLLGAACMAGFVTSFIVVPIERIKVMMQASSEYRNEWICLNAILKTEGWPGLVSRGLGPTLAREVPSYSLYFLSYGLMTGHFDLGAMTPLICGAAAGMFAWLPVYPIDVVKTLVQNTAGDKEQVSSWVVMRQVYATGGVGAFFDGLTPKLLRAAVNHATTWYVYELIMRHIQA